MSAPKVQFAATTVVWVDIRGESRGKGYVRDDGGLVGRFLRWLCEQDGLYPVDSTGGHSGGGSYGYAFYPRDAERVVAWLDAQPGVERVAQHDRVKS